MTLLRRWLGPAVSVVALAAVVYWMVHQPAPQLPDSAAGFSWLALSLGLSLGALALRGYRWHRVMVLADVDHKRTDALALTAVAYMGNNVLPARGGEVLKIAILGTRSASRKREILGSVVAERLLDAVVLAGMFIVLSFGLADSPTGPGTAALFGAVILAGFAALFVYLRLRRSGRFERFAATIRPVARGLRLFAHPSGLPLVGLSILIWVVEGLNLIVIVQSIGLSLSVLDGVLIIVLASLAAAIPAAPGFAGTYDWAMILGLKTAGITGGAASGILILSRFMYFVPATVVGLIVLVTRYGGLSAARRRLQGERRLPVHG
ncbi:flippase-like domain-containing protein [Solirubrobacter sp. CPCC 204708]|uniref:Flippase-like domain-containing protein n=1 Tax=Solirubrobacter deserti TaxID=2282478 RepID=A0ABT4RNA0_9ACTN|nr:lysylphosphatidylglycerol synthase transmembrane domain-containing protein [Solirubrobacter deserti]MBE2317437.1 flippase-like domain-containing protein [Solirubrobacter deserti]MDA0140019.1 flippase-like domain-containing protein [Solirubrobacter deserti]